MAVIVLLKGVPGWHKFEHPEIGELCALKGADRVKKEAREHLHPALLLYSLYGFRPEELLQSSLESSIHCPDSMGTSRLVLRIDIN